MSSIIGDSVSFGGGSGGSGNIASLSITENGTYTASGGVDGYSPIIVSVSGGGGSLNILSGRDEPTDAQGNNGAIYLKYGPRLYSIQDLVSSEGALSIAVSANSYWSGYEPWKAFTTASNTGWIGNGGNPHWLQVVTQTDVTIKTISFYANDSSRAHAISRVGYSEDGTTFTDAPLSSSTMVNRNGKAVLSQGATGKYFRIYFDGSYVSYSYPMMEKVKIMAEGQGFVVDATYAKVNGAWQSLIGTDINDINLGN